MLPGQRTSRRLQALESQAFSTATNDDGYDDFGIPNSAGEKKGRGSLGTKRSGLFGRKKRGTASSTAVDAYDNDSDDDVTGFSVLPGTPSSARPDIAGMMGQQPGYGPEGGLVGGQLPQPGDLAHLNNLNHGDISMDQLTTIKDRHRYPTMEGDLNGSRAMSLTSMSNYDTTPIIPMLGPLNNFQSGSSHNKSSQQEKYRQRMIESRRALMSSESGIPMSGNPTVPLHGPEQAYGSPRTMSMGSMNSQMTSGSAPGGFARVGAPPGGRSNTMGSMGIQGHPMQGHSMQGPPMQGPPMQGQPMQGQPMQGQPMQGQPPGPYHQRPPYGAPMHPNNGQWVRPGMAGQGPNAYNLNPNLMPPPAQGGPAPFQGRNSGNLYPQQGPYAQQQHAQTHTNQRASHPMLGSTMAPPMVTPHIGATSPANPAFSPADPSEAPPAQFPRGTHPPQVGLQHTNSNDDDLDFGPLPPSPPASSQKAPGAKREMNETNSEPAPREEVDTHEKDRNEGLFLSLKNDVRVLTIALAESTRRELDLAKPQNGEPPSSQATAAEELASVYSELSLERAKREAAEEAARKNGSSPELPEKLAELDYRHSEATHLLSIRTEQYNALTRSHDLLKEDFAKKQEEMNEITSKSKKAEVSSRLYEQDQQLRTEVDTLKHENSQLREQLDQLTSRGPLGSRISALEDQRSALQEALRAMRERKDTEIRALNKRIETLTLDQQRRTTSSSSAASGSGTPGSRLTSEGHGSTSSLFKSGLKVAPLNQNETGQLSLPRIRQSTLSRPASPLHLGLDYNR